MTGGKNTSSPYMEMVVICKVIYMRMFFIQVVGTDKYPPNTVLLIYQFLKQNRYTNLMAVVDVYDYTGNISLVWGSQSISVI